MTFSQLCGIVVSLGEVVGKIANQVKFMEMLQRYTPRPSTPPLGVCAGMCAGLCAVVDSVDFAQCCDFEWNL